MSDVFQNLKRRFEELQEEIPVLRTCLERTISELTTNKLPDDAQISALECTLSGYRQKLSGLQEAGKQMSIEIPSDLTLLEEQIQSFALREKENLVDAVHSYLRLTVQKETTAATLEETKRELTDKCRRGGENLETELLPYAVVVNRAKNLQPHLSDEEFDLVYSSIARAVARAVDQGLLVIDDGLDISGYLDGSCEWLQPEAEHASVDLQETDTEQNDAGEIPCERSTEENDASMSGSRVPNVSAGGQADAEAAELPDETVPADVSYDDEDTQYEEESDDELPFGEDYGYYLTPDMQYSMMDDTPSGELASKTFEKHFNKTQGMILLGLMFTAEQRISSACDEDFDDDFHLPSVSLLEYMEKHKYLRRIEAVRDGEARTYWTLSSKGWACFSKKEVAAKLRKMDIDLNSIGKDSAVNWTKLVTARYIELFDYMLALKEHYWARRWDEIVYGAVIDDEAIYYIPGVFTMDKGSLGKLFAFIRIMGDEKDYAIIVKDRHDAECFKSAMEKMNRSLDEEDRISMKLVSYVIQGSDEEYYSREGEEGVYPYECDEEDDEDAASMSVEDYFFLSDDDAEKPATNEASGGNSEIGEEAEEPDSGMNGPDIPDESDAAEDDDQSSADSGGQAGASTENRAEAPLKVPETEAGATYTEPEENETKEPEQAAQSESDGVKEREDGEHVNFNKRADKTADDADISVREMTEPEENTDHERLDDALTGAWRIMAAGRKDVASAVLRYLVQITPELKTTVDQFAYATGDPAITAGPSSNTLQAVFNMPAGLNMTTDLLAASAYLRMYFSYAAGEQTYLSRDMSHQKDSLAIRRYPELKDILYSLADWVKYQQRGLDDELIDIVLRNMDTGMIQEEISRRAEELLNSRLTESSHGNKRIKKNREILFGVESSIHKILVGIRDNDAAQKKLAESFMCQSVDDVIDTSWDEAARLVFFGRNENCIGAERATLTRQLNSIRELAEDWLRVNAEGNHVGNEQSRAASVLFEKLKKLMVILQGKLDGKDANESIEVQAAKAVLSDALEDCLAMLSGMLTEDVQRYRYYINLLKEPLIALDDLSHPHIETLAEETQPYDFYERAVCYLNRPDRSWSEVLSRIFNGPGPDRQGMDYGSAALIRQYLQLTEQTGIWKAEYDIEAAAREATDKKSVKRSSVGLWEQDFAARLEMADGDNWFDADQSLRAHINRVIEYQKDTYYYSENFGFYGRAMNRLLALLRDKAQSLRPRYQEEYDRLTEGRSEEELELPIFAQIAEMIDHLRFGAAESFMQQVRNGNLTIGDGKLGSGTLEDFLNRVNRELYNASRLDTKKTLVATYQGMHRRIINATQRSGEALTKVWPEGGSLSPERLKTFFTELDQQVESVSGQGTEFVVHFSSRGIVMDYPHPIAAFGSVMERKGLNVVITSGVLDADGLSAVIDRILSRIRDDRPLMILANSAITVADRRKMAKSTSRLTSNKPFLLLDRCLVLYLADLPKIDRWKALLRCTMPFRVINPYMENSSMPIPPDMFIGRREEIQKIIAPDGPNLLYGGRQLGKTAILRRVEFQQNRPEEGNWAAYVDIRDLNQAEAAKSIAKALHRSGFMPENNQPASFKQLIEAVEGQLMDTPENRSHTLLLMLDETDNLLKLFEADDFRALGDMKRLQMTTSGRFKFILAGLHNVVRFSQRALSANSVLPHLGGITIEPMKFSDGRELLEVPLSYLGFTIDPGQEDIIAQILYNTNYFPGLIHFYASRLVEHMKEISSEVTTPPYRLSRDVLLRLIGDESFRQQRREKLMMTLQVEEKEEDAYYYTLAYALATYSYENEDVLLHGASASELKKICLKENQNCRIGRLSDHQVEVLLDELVTLNILRCEERDSRRYFKFSRSSFLEMLGSEDDVLMTFMEILEKEARPR